MLAEYLCSTIIWRENNIHKNTPDLYPRVKMIKYIIIFKDSMAIIIEVHPNLGKNIQKQNFKCRIATST